MNGRDPDGECQSSKSKPSQPLNQESTLHCIYTCPSTYHDYHAIWLRIWSLETLWFDRLLYISCSQTSQTFQGLLHSSFIVLGSITALSHPFTITTLAAFFAATADSVAKQGKPTRGESTDVMWSEESKGKWWMVKQIREVRYVQPRCWRIRAWQAKLPECLKMQKRSLKNMKRSHIYLLFGHMLSLEHD